jgi:hypothetical protein
MDLFIGHGRDLKIKQDRDISHHIIYNDIRHCYILKVETCGFTDLPILWKRNAWNSSIMRIYSSSSSDEKGLKACAWGS